MPTAGHLTWRCRRGMRELDTLLTRYLDNCYPTAAMSERQAFEALLELTDPEIWDCLFGHRLPPDDGLRHVIERIAPGPTRT